ncbi:unnamed protein product [Staurois parvus]|uniref:Uncharacterized protein n=1 Tax=Staurois parvus TaxID=386267 RepID=A0ABN9DW18_9NEOB|nr:unnamed protein product [Staurois parvus]
MCPLQRPRPSPPADAGFCVPVPVTSGRTGAAGGGKFEEILHSKTLLFQPISHTFCP